MKYLFHVVIASLVLMGATVCAQEPAPKFTEYPARVVRTRRSVKVQIHTTPDTACFRTMLRKVAREGELFAGHYAIGYWGCGTCIRVGIVNLLNGRAYVTPFEASEPPAAGAFKVKPNSRLLIIDDAVRTDGSWYYLWNGRELLEIYDGRKLARREREFLPCSAMNHR